MIVPDQNNETAKVELGTYIEPVSLAVSPGDLHNHALVCGCDEATNDAICMRVAQMVKGCGRPVLIIEPDKEEYLSWAEMQNKSLAPEEQWHIFRAGMDGGGGSSHEVEQLVENGLTHGQKTDDEWPTSLTSLRSGLSGEHGCVLDGVAHAEQPEESVELFQKPCVVNLMGIRDASAKRFVMNLLLLAAGAYDKSAWMSGFSRKRGAESEGLARLVVIQSARRLFWKEDGGVMSGGMQPFGLSGELLDYLKEVRNYGQNVLLADQSPSLLGKDVVDLSGLKVCGRLPCGDDEDLMRDAMGVSSFRSLENGEMIVRIGSSAPARIGV